LEGNYLLNPQRKVKTQNFLNKGGKLTLGKIIVSNRLVLGPRGTLDGRVNPIMKTFWSKGPGSNPKKGYLGVFKPHS